MVPPGGCLGFCFYHPELGENQDSVVKSSAFCLVVPFTFGAIFFFSTAQICGLYPHFHKTYSNPPQPGNLKV